MSSPITLPLSQIVDVVVQVSPQTPPTPQFNQGLIVGPSAVIPSVGGLNSRIRKYLTLAAMLSDGFTVNSPEYIAAQLYFSQQPAATTLWVGRQDATAIASFTLGASGGTGYTLGDVLTVVQGGGSLGQVKVSSLGGSNAITGVVLLVGGTGYTVANNLATTGGTGTGAQIDITAIGETPLVALQNCRNANFQWWACMVTSAVKADHIAIAAYMQTALPVACYFFTTSDVDALAGNPGNVFATLQALSYNRVFGQWSSTQSGTAPNNAYACAAAMGVAMGKNTGLANSAFTMKFEAEVGVVAEPLSPTSIGVIEGENGNLYLSYGNAYTFLEQGTVANGQFFDEILNLDMLSSSIQYNLMNLLVSNPKIPQTDAGQTQLIDAVNSACETAFVSGFLGPGVWKGVQVLNLQPGASLPRGYLTQSPAYATQVTSDRTARKSMPIYVAITEAGAVHSVLIGVFVQR